MAFLRAAPSRWARWAVRNATVAALLVLAPLSGLWSQQVQATANQVKAVFLYNFAQFVDWPETAFAGPESPLVIGILGEDPFGSYLDETVRGERVRGRPLVVRRFRLIEDVGKCHILFVRTAENAEPETILEALKGRPTLTVSDAPGFLRSGGMVGFVVERSRVRVRINPDAVTRAGLLMSSKLLHVAELVNPRNP